MRLRRAARWAVALTVAMSTCASPAWAAGDTDLDALMVAAPSPEWEPLTASELDQIVSLEERLMHALVGDRARVAAQGWLKGPERIVVVLIALPDEVPDLGAAPRQAALSFCTSATNNPPTSIGDFAPIVGASTATCSRAQPDGSTLSLTAFSWITANVFAIIGGSGLPAERFEKLVLEQFKQLPARGVSVGDGGGGNAEVIVGIVVLGIAVLGIVGLGVVVLVRRRTRPRSSPASLPPSSMSPPPGWYPLGEPSRQGYWDGNGWIAQKRWDGTAWIDLGDVP